MGATQKRKEVQTAPRDLLPFLISFLCKHFFPVQTCKNFLCEKPFTLSHLASRILTPTPDTSSWGSLHTHPLSDFSCSASSFKSTEGESDLKSLPHPFQLLSFCMQTVNSVSCTRLFTTAYIQPHSCEPAPPEIAQEHPTQAQFSAGEEKDPCNLLKLKMTSTRRLRVIFCMLEMSPHLL